MNIAPNTREQRLMSRFEMAVEKALSEDGTVQDIDDAFVCFITLFHSPICRIDEKLKSKNDCLSLKINTDDIEILKHLKNKKSKDADGPLAMIKDKLPIGNEKPDIRKFMYINNVVFLSRALQYCGGFVVYKLNKEYEQYVYQLDILLEEYFSILDSAFAVDYAQAFEGSILLAEYTGVSKK